MDLSEALEQAAQWIASATRILVITHRRPDGDGMGSMCGLGVMLRAAGKQVMLACNDGVPRRFRWLPGALDVVPALGVDARFDCTIVLDCGDLALLEGGLPEAGRAGRVIAIDHHAVATPFGDVFVWDPAVAAVAVLVMRLAQRLDLALSPDAATGFYVALISDTGGFRNANTNADALATGAALVTAGAKPAYIANCLEERTAPAKLRLLGAVLSSFSLHCGSRVGVLEVSDERLASSGASWEHVEGMVNWARNVEGVVVGVLFSITAGGLRVSMRARTDAVDVGRVCATFGGGGHPGSGGGFIAGPVEPARATVLAALDAALAASRT